jgi:hypothetical protein
MTTIGSTLSRIAAGFHHSFRRPDQLVACNGTVHCPSTGTDMDIERCYSCPRVIGVSVDASGEGVVECSPKRFDWGLVYPSA